MYAPDGTVTLVNPHASLLLDCTTDEIIHKQIDTVLQLTMENAPTTPFPGIAHTVFAKKKTYTVPQGATAYVTTHSGRRFPVFVASRTISLEDGVVGILVFRDITKEKTLEHYKEHTAQQLSELTPILQRAATGDFSTVPNVPREENEFTELYVGVRLMVEDLRQIAVDRKREQAERILAIQKTEADRRALAEEYAKHLEKQVEEKTEEITRAKVHVETLIDTLPNGLLEYDNAFTLLRMNRKAEELLGVSPNEVTGHQVFPRDLHKPHWQTLVDVSYPALAPVAKKMTRENAGKDVDITEIKVTYPLERELQVTTTPVLSRATGARQGFIKLVRDITREKTIARSKSEFISIAAHQLRTPLSAIKWVLHMVINGDTGPLQPSQKELLTNGYETNEKMIQLVNDLLNVARIEEGRFGYTFKQGDLMPVIESVLASIKGFAQSNQVSVVVKMPSATLPPLTFDANKMALVFQNLIDNAVKYTPVGGTVTIDVSVDKEHLITHIRDTGIGIPASQMPRLFTKFFRADNALHMQTSGSGLGLYLAKNVVIRHGGALTVSSTEGVGTVFTLALPLDARRIPQDDITVDDT